MDTMEEVCTRARFASTLNLSFASLMNLMNDFVTLFLYVWYGLTIGQQSMIIVGPASY